MPKYLSGKVRRTPLSGLSSDRYRYLELNQAEPNLGDPLVGPSSIGANPIKSGNQYIIVAVDGYPGERFWIPNQGGLIPGSISVFDEGNLVGTLSSITQLNFKGAAVTASASLTGVAATITIFAPGNNQELLFNSSNEFGTSSKLTFNSSTGLLTAGDAITVGAGGTVITTTSGGFVGIRTENPTQELDLNGDLRLRGTIYDYNNQPGTSNQVLTKNNLGGVLWVSPATIRAGAGGTYQNVQFHNSAGLVDGASTFVYDEVNSRVGIGSTIPQKTLDVLGYSRFKGQTEIDYLNVTGVSTIATLGVSGLTTTRNLTVTGITTVGFLTGTSAYYTGIVTASKFIGDIDVTNLNVTGIATIKTLGVTGVTTTLDLTVHRNLKVVGIATFDNQVNINNLNVTGVNTVGNIKLQTNTVFTNSGNLILDSLAGTTQINDALYVNDTTDSTSTTDGSLYTKGGVGIAKSLYVGGAVNLAVSGGISTTGGDLYVGNNLYVKNASYYGSISGATGEFTEFLKTKNFQVTGIATIATLGVTGLTTSKDLTVYNNFKVSGISTFSGLVYSNIGAYINNVQIGISNPNTIDTTTGNLTISSSGGYTTISNALNVTGISTFDSATTFKGNVQFGDATTDTVSFTSRVNSSILPSVTNNYNLGSSSLYWNNVYAQTFNGQFVGIADTAKQISTGTTTGTSSYYLTFVDSNNAIRDYEYLYTDAEISYNPSTDLLNVGKLYVSGISTFNSNSKFINNITVDGATTLGLTGSNDLIINASLASTIRIKTTDLYDLGTSSSSRLNNVYAKTFNGQFLGNSDTASQVSTGTTTGTSPYYLTFVHSNNGTRGNEYLYTDDVLNYNPSTDLLSLTNVTVSGVSTFNGNVSIGDSITDKVSFASTVNSNFIPSATDTYDLGSSAVRWNNVYAKTFNGQFVGIADTAKQISTGTTTGIGTYYLTFVDTNNATRDYEYLYTDVGISYNPSTDLLSLTNVTVSGITTIGNSNSDTITFNSTVNSNIIPNGTQNLGSTTNRWDNLYVNTITGNVTGSASSLSVTAGTANTTRYFILSDIGTTGITTQLNVDTGISYNPSTNLLTVADIKPASIRDSTGTGSTNAIIKADGSGGWSWSALSSIGVGMATDLAINGTNQLLYQISNNNTGVLPQGTAGYILQSNGTSAPSWLNPASLTVGIATSATNSTNATNLAGGTAGSIPYQLSANTTTFLTDPNQNGYVLTWNDTSNSPQWTSPSNASSVTVNQTGYTCTNPITTSGSTITIGTNSNAYGTRWISSNTPTTQGCDGDIWYQIT